MGRVLIIAEAGVNHNGSMANAKKLIDVAADAGVDIVKFQSFKAENIVSKAASKAHYQQKTTDRAESQYDMLKRLELSERDHDALIAYCQQQNITFLSTPFDEESIDLLKAKGIKIGKIPSGEITNLPYLEAMGKTFPEIILSTGMANMQEIRWALEILLRSGTKKEKVTILHCNTEYPTPMKDVNLLAMNAIAKEFDIAIGYSDHTLGIEVPIAAVALGATVIEKHFTLNRNMQGPDHSASLEPPELKAMVKAIRNIEQVIGGSGIKEPSASESKNIIVARKSIHFSKSLLAGHVLTEKDLIMKRPGNGISPLQRDIVIGRKLVKNVKADQMLLFTDLET
ncbi:MAG: N-acetylneuraminate synthase [Bacteroidia bacterium]